MSSLFFCYACGHTLTFISDKRMKCYGCGKYFVDSFEETLCGCRKRLAFQYSVEIIAPNKGKCICCGKEFKVEGNTEPTYTDKLLESKRGSNFSIEPLKPVAYKRQGASQGRLSKEANRQINFEPDIFDENDRFLIVGDLPLHQSIDEVTIEIENGILSLKSLISGIDFKKKFVLPQNVIPESRKAIFKNSILEICFLKKVPTHD